jgi:hypothetical protein
MNRIIYLSIIIALCCTSASLFAETVKEVNADSTQALGLQVGIVSGYGIGYRYFFTEGSMKNFGIQGVLGGYSSGNNDTSFRPQDAELHGTDLIDSDPGKKYYLNIGLSGIYILKKTSLFNFYLAGGMDWVYETKKTYYQEYDAADAEIGDPYAKTKTKNLLSMGVGPGAELKLGRYFKISVDLPITYTGSHELIMYIPQVGVYYYFK